MKFRNVFLALFFLLIPSFALAVPQLINYQGKLTDAAGTPITGTRNITFSFYDAATGGTSLWTETQSANLANGIFSVTLGSNTTLPSDICSSDSLYLGITVEGDSEMTPRQRITSAAYAQKAASAADADKLGGQPASGFATRAYVDSTLNATAPDADKLGGLPPGDYALTTDPRFSDARTPVSGSANYIQNTSQAQSGANLNIDGKGIFGSGIKIGNDVASCSASNAGSIRWDGASAGFQGCNGTEWVDLTPRNINYVTGLNQDNTDDGFVNGRLLVFAKKNTASKLRITYSDNFRVLNPNNAGQWEIYIDGSPVIAPLPLKMSVYNGNTGYTHSPGTIIGYASGYPAGNHTIQVRVSPASGYSGTDCYTGWNSTFLLEVEEVP